MPNRVVDITGRTTPRRLALWSLVLIGAVLIGFRPPHAQERDATPLSGARWIDLTPADSSNVPEGSEDGALIYDPLSHRVVLYGGKDDGDVSSKETWAFQSAERTWEQIHTNGKTPPASEDHTTIYDPNGHRLLLHGGENGPTSNKLFALDLETYTWRDLTNSNVPKRESHTAVYDSRGKRMVVFGGYENAKVDLYDVLALDLDPASPTFEQWEDLSVALGRPPGRLDHAAVYDPAKNRMVFHGGWSKSMKGLFGDTWAFYFADAPGGQGRWERLAVDVQPPPRRHGAAAFDPDRNLFILFGGEGARGYLNDAWALDLTHDVWTNITPEVPGPVPRIDHQAVYDPQLHAVLIYGGDGGLDKKLHDVWELALPPVE